MVKALVSAGNGLRCGYDLRHESVVAGLSGLGGTLGFYGDNGR